MYEQGGGSARDLVSGSGFIHKEYINEPITKNYITMFPLLKASTQT